MPVWVLQVAAVFVGLLALGFFAFAAAYYVRNRRNALAARERLSENNGSASILTDAEALEAESPGETQQ